MLDWLLGPYGVPLPWMEQLGAPVTQPDYYRLQQNVSDETLARQWGEMARQAEEYRRWRSRADDADELREAHGRMADAGRNP